MLRKKNHAEMLKEAFENLEKYNVKSDFLHDMFEELEDDELDNILKNYGKENKKS